MIERYHLFVFITIMTISFYAAWEPIIMLPMITSMESSKEMCASCGDKSKVFPSLEYYSSYICLSCCVLFRKKTAVLKIEPGVRTTKRTWTGFRTPHKPEKMVDRRDTPIANQPNSLDTLAFGSMRLDYNRYGPRLQS